MPLCISFATDFFCRDSVVNLLVILSYVADHIMSHEQKFLDDFSYLTDINTG